MLTPKENYLKCMHGEIPEWVPTLTMGMTHDGSAPSDVVLEPRIVSEHRIRGGGRDFWGVEYVPTESTGNALIPKTSDFILDDIRKWRDVIKAPDLSGVDWEKMCRDDFDRLKIDRSKSAVIMLLHMGYFQDLMSFMGFSNGLCAMYEEPEEVKALLEYLCDFYCEVAARYVDHAKPDVWGNADDTAAWANPFISPDMYREFLIPLYDRQFKFGRDRGIPISMHNCGKSACFFDDLVKIGVTEWNPAQTCNDLAAIKKKYGNRLVICGGWDARGHLLDDNVTYEEIYESIKAQMDQLAPGGGYCFCGGYLGAVGDQKVVQKNMWVTQAVSELSHRYY
jgi:hypothetical protein